MKKDKLFHAIAGFVIAMLVGFVLAPLMDMPNPEVSNGGVAFVVALLAGGAKEWYDAKKGGVVDAYDAMATGLGGLVGAIIVWIA